MTDLKLHHQEQAWAMTISGSNNKAQANTSLGPGPLNPKRNQVPL